MFIKVMMNDKILEDIITTDQFFIMYGTEHQDDILFNLKHYGEARALIYLPPDSKDSANYFQIFADNNFYILDN